MGKNMNSRCSLRKKTLHLLEVINSSKKRVRLFLAGIPLLKRILFFYRHEIKRKLLGFLLTKRFSYKKSYFSCTFLADTPINNQYTFKTEIPEQIYCFWTGDNEMSQARRKALDVLIRNAEAKVILVTPINLEQFIKSDFPLHPGFQYLSLVHKSDYLRCYFMHHYGGGYSDIKRTISSWQEPFRQIISSPDKWIIGYREFGLGGVAPIEGQLGSALKRNWYILLGNCAYICKPGTPFTVRWYQELHKRMDFYLEQLKENPGNVLGDNPGYPIPWTRILGEIFHPLCLKYHNRLIYSDRLKPIIEGYR